MEMALPMFLMTMLWTGASAQSSDCTSVLISMSPCLSYITGNSSTPSSGCCSQLATVVRSQPLCLCEVLSGSGMSSLGININQTQAIELPGACKVQTPPISSCSTGGSPTESSSPDSPTTPEAGSPEGSPTTGSAESPQPTITGRGSNSLPSDNGSSDASSAKLASALFLFLVLVATSASTSIL